MGSDWSKKTSFLVTRVDRSVIVWREPEVKALVSFRWRETQCNYEHLSCSVAFAAEHSLYQRRLRHLVNSSHKTWIYCTDGALHGDNISWQVRPAFPSSGVDAVLLLTLELGQTDAGVLLVLLHWTQ